MQYYSIQPNTTNLTSNKKMIHISMKKDSCTNTINKIMSKQIILSNKYN